MFYHKLNPVNYITSLHNICFHIPPSFPTCLHPWQPGARLNIKMPSFQYRDYHVKDKTVSPTVLSLTWESPYLGKTVFILRRGPAAVCKHSDNGYMTRNPSTTNKQQGISLTHLAPYFRMSLIVCDVSVIHCVNILKKLLMLHITTLRT